MPLNAELLFTKALFGGIINTLTRKGARRSMKNKKLGIYIHIPFCIRKCNYCDFCSFPDASGSLMESYTAALCKKIRNFAPLAQEYSIDTVYFGGGTPTLLSAELFEKILSVLFSEYDIEGDAEISCECNPASIDAYGLGALRKMGINRLSIGLQSANENELRALGRVHSFEDFKRTFREARAAGFDNISADLMYGIPHQTEESFRHTLHSLVELSPEHISAYGLKIEDGTAFARTADTLPLPDEDVEYNMYCLLTELLENHGYRRYEISNFAKKGFESRHNMRYWQRGEYIGFGVAAHSFFGGERFGNSRDISAFIRGEDIVCEREVLTDNDLLDEYIMLSLRLSSGLRRGEFQRLSGKTVEDAFPQLRGLVEGGFLHDDGESISFTTKGFFVSNVILADMLNSK